MLNKTIQSISISALAIILLLLTFVGNIVKADNTNRIMITGFTFEDEEIRAEKAFDFSVQVLAVEAGEEENAALSKSEPENDAIVDVIFTKNNIKKEVTLKNGVDGKYTGNVTLPVDGEWTLTANASKDGQNTGGDNAFTTTFNVDEAESGGSIFWKILLIVASVLVLIWTLKRLEPKLKQIQKKKPRV